MKLNLELSLDDVNTLLRGLDYYKLSLDNLGQSILQTSQIQIDEYNKKIEEEQQKMQEENNQDESVENKKNKEKGDNK